jgi:hypothetical protein
MRECGYCGKSITRRKEKGGREREYCNDTCRQLAYRARHPEKRYVDRLMRGMRRERWKEDPHLMPWQEELKAREKCIERLKGEALLLEMQNNTLSWDLRNRDDEVRHLRWKLAEAEAEIVRLNVLLDSQSKRKS